MKEINSNDLYSKSQQVNYWRIPGRRELKIRLTSATDVHSVGVHRLPVK